jgi:hypothetical protein
LIAAGAALFVSTAGDALLTWLFQTWNGVSALTRGWFG